MGRIPTLPGIFERQIATSRLSTHVLSSGPDDATDVIEELPSGEAEQILIEMEPAEAAEIRELLAYPPDSAGGLMTPAFSPATSATVDPSSG